MARPKKNTNKQLLADKMRKAVLQAAIEGKLTEQYPITDGYARDLLADIESEKQRLIKAGEIKRQKSLSDITEEEQPFDIPDNWEWVKFGSIVHFNMGKTPPRSNLSYWGKDLPWVSIADMTNSSLITSTKEKVSLKAIDDIFKNRIVKSGTMLMSFKLSIGRVSILKIDAVHNEAIISINTFNNIDLQGYLFHILEYVSNWGDSRSAIKGKTLNSTSLNNMLVPLPPIAEQRRIVAKLKEALAQIDILHADENALYTLQTAFPRQIQASLLQAAIEGKLTQQDATKDGNASDLLADIEREKQRLFKAGEINRQKTLPPIIEEEKPFDIPDNWEWVRLGTLCSKVGSGSTPSGGRAVYKEKGISFIRSQNVHNHGLILDNVAFIDNETHLKKAGSTVYPKDILLNITGASIGRSCVIPDDFDVGNTNQHVLTLRQIEPKIRYFIHLVLTSPFVFNSIMSVQVGGTKEGLSASKAKELLIPLPPLAEQQRIVDLLEQALPEIQTLKDI